MCREGCDRVGGGGEIWPWMRKFNIAQEEILEGKRIKYLGQIPKY